MAVKNSLVKKDNDGAITYDANGEQVKLSSDMIRKYLVNGNGTVSDQEVVMFLSLCKFQHLNPFLREAYLIKYGTSPATTVVGKDVLLKRAMRSAKYEGSQAGVIIVDNEGNLKEREGTFVLDSETLVGGWAKVYLNGYSNPVYTSVSMKEYSTGKSNWLSKPATMIRKVALAQALREAFPEEMSQLYDATEMDKTIFDTTKQEIVLDATPVEIPSESPVTASEEVKVIEPSPVEEKPSKRNSGGQAAIDDVMFPPILDNQPPFEI